MARLLHGNSRFAAILLVILASAAALHAQVSTPLQEKDPVAEEIPYVLHIDTREVVIDVIAVDGHDRSVTDLAPADLRISEKLGKSAEIPESVSSFRLIDPQGSAHGDLPESGFRIAANESCLQRQSIHYQLVYNPGQQALTQGFHEVHITTARRGVHLFYRHNYYIGATAPVESAVSQTRAQINHELALDACSHPLVPLSISLRAARIATGSKDTARFKVSIENDSLAFVSFSNSGRGLQLDYGACNFNAAGKPIGYMTVSTDQVLSPVEYARVESHGLQRILEFAPPADLAMTRFVVRDRATGNLGLADVTFPLVEAPSQVDPAVIEKLSQQSQQSSPVYAATPMGPLGSFGSVVPRPNAFCGDVYELKSDVAMLPDFRGLDPIGSIYTPSLAVPNQIFEGTNGIPGVTDRTVWFGVDYRATFWVRDAGTYDFRLTTDDGAILQIDDKRVISLDGLHPALTKDGHIALDEGLHTIHIPYYEGTPYAVALSLMVNRPGENVWRIFDLRDFAEPAHQAR